MMDKKEIRQIDQVLGKGEEASIYNRVTDEIKKEEAVKPISIPKQADNWNALAHQVVGAKNLEHST